MARLDLDDLPPRIAAQLASLSDGEELLLVQYGVVVARLAAAVTPVPEEAEPPPPEQQVKEVFENFRSVIEDDF